MLNQFTRPAAMILGLASLATTSHAAIYSGNTTASTGSNYSGSVPLAKDSFNSVNSPGSARADNHVMGALATSNASASASVGAGALHVSASSAGFAIHQGTSGDVAYGEAKSYGRLYDDFVVDAAPALKGTKGTITVAFSIDGSLSADGTGAWSSAAQWLGHVGVSSINGNGYWSGENESTMGTFGGRITRRITITFLTTLVLVNRLACIP
jgi:hypothetical protein